MLTSTRTDDVVRARLDCGRRNALGFDAIAALRELFRPDGDASVVLLSGRPDGFCVGLDNAILAAGRAERGRLLGEMGTLLLEILQSSTRLVAAVEGHAVAAGAMLLLVADARLGVEGDYQIGFTEPRLGVTLPELPALLARSRLRRDTLHRLTVLGETVGPAEAAEAGFLDAVVDPETLESRASERATVLAALSAEAYAGTMQTVHGDALAAIERLVARQRDLAAPG